jgi:uncharacterized repeat protein (TIGR01451 family)
LTNGTSLRNLNSGFMGTGGVVGVDNQALPTLSRPEFEIWDDNNRNIGLDLQAANTTLRHLAIYGFGDSQNNDGEANIRVGAFNGTLIEACVIGASAGSFTAPAEVDTGDNIRVVGGDNGIIRNNLIGFSGGNGIGMKNDADGWEIQGNEIRDNASQDLEMNGISLEDSRNATIQGNLISGSRGAGIDTPSSTGAHTIENNTIRNNGTGNVETPGIRLYGTGSLVDRNRIYNNTGAGVLVTTAAVQNILTRNSFYDNGAGSGGQIGIDLLSGGNQRTGDSPYVTLNDSGDSDSGGNGLLNFPILESASIEGGNLVVRGFARPNSIVELYLAKIDPSRFGEGQTYLATWTEGSGDDGDGTSGSYGPGAINGLTQGGDTTNRFRFEIPTPPGVSIGTYLTATATLGGATSEFSGIVSVGPLAIFGRVVEDVNGDAGLADAVGRPSVLLNLYRDGGDGQPNGDDDNFVTSVTTDVSGNYNFQDLGSGDYWVVVDSKTITPSAGFRGGFDIEDVWAEQTYGDNSYSSAQDMGARFGGRSGDVSDNAGSLDGGEHLARVIVGSTNVNGVDFGFSFNVVTNVRGGANGDDDTSAARTVQGSLRQFLQNANAITGPNSMRFVPSVVANAGSWWQLLVTEDLPDILDSNTTIDGTAYSFNDGTSLRNLNPGSMGAGGSVGVDSQALPTLSRPEFEILDGDNRNIGLDLQAANATVRHLAIYGFGDAQNNDGEANIRVGKFSGTLIEACVIGAAAGSFTAPAEVDTADNLRVVESLGGTIRNNLIGFSGGNGIGIKKDTGGWVIQGNEIRGNATQNAELNGISLEECSNVIARENLIIGSQGAGIDTRNSIGAHTIENNTITNNGTGTVETPGIRVYGTGSTIGRNIIHENYGAGILVTKDALQNTITRNSIYDNGPVTGQIGIDLIDGGDEKAGDSPFFTLNDDGDGDNGGNDMLNFPVLVTAETTASGFVLTGFARPGSIIELFIADPEPSGFGEGRTYITSLTENSGDDLDNTSGSYGPAAVNGIVQGEDTTNRFRFEIPIPPGVNLGTVLTATATQGGSTSEFSGNIAVTGITAVPDIVLVKSVQTFSDPFNGQTNPKAIPGAVMLYTIAATNQGVGSIDADSVVITDPIPANTVLFVGDIDGPGPATGPVLFTDGTSPDESGLSYTFISLGSMADDVAFSNNGGSSYGYVPMPDADGFDANVTHMQITLKGIFNGTSGGNSPRFEIRLKVGVE